MGSTTWISTNQGQFGQSHCSVPNLPRAKIKINTKPLKQHHSLGEPAATWQQVDYTGSLPSLKEQPFLLTGKDIYARYGFASPTLNASAKTTLCGLTECIIHFHSIPCNTASDKETHFIANEEQHWAQTHGILQYHQVPFILKQQI